MVKSQRPARLIKRRDMKTIWVQDQRTKRFLGKWGEWTTHAGAARNFPTTLNAVVHCVQKEFGHVQLVIHVDDSPPDIIVPVDEERSRLAQDFASEPPKER